ncbi:hypothetical protein IGI04_009508 [Brassica rapa subsp. trilocularis]|uniref:Secreted protein n=1 Tax=Brassica rapa subsp. trilocularis TaxID=1813537 RepID=A0ABQ7MXG8_BRACM|nr:hypothetical protein IGI04_009508 [Brassica rapa subsp. trilocularis]
MTERKTIQFLLLSLVHILLCVSLQVGVTEARFRHLGVVKWTKKIGVSPSPPCGAHQRRPPYKRETEKSCRLFPPRAP